MLRIYFKAPKAYEGRVLGFFSKAYPYLRLDWSYSIYLRGDFKQAIRLAEGVRASLRDTRQLKKALFILARSYYHIGSYKKSLKVYTDLLDLDSDKYFFESLFRIGLLHYRFKEYERASQVFETLAKTAEKKQRVHIEDKSLYWLLRSLEKMKVDALSQRMMKPKENLLKKYPLSYYTFLVKGLSLDKKVLQKKDIFKEQETKRAQKNQKRDQSFSLWLLANQRKDLKK